MKQENKQKVWRAHFNLKTIRRERTGHSISWNSYERVKVFHSKVHFKFSVYQQKVHLYRENRKLLWWKQWPSATSVRWPEVSKTKTQSNNFQLLISFPFHWSPIMHDKQNKSLLKETAQLLFWTKACKNKDWSEIKKRQSWSPLSKLKFRGIHFPRKTIYSWEL